MVGFWDARSGFQPIRVAGPFIGRSIGGETLLVGAVSAINEYGQVVGLATGLSGQVETYLWTPDTSRGLHGTAIRQDPLTSMLQTLSA